MIIQYTHKQTHCSPAQKNDLTSSDRQGYREPILSPLPTTDMEHILVFAQPSQLTGFC